MSEDGERIDRYLIRMGLARSRRAARDMIAAGSVRVNETLAKKGDLVRESDRVDAGRPGERPAAIVANPALALRVLYEDAAVLVVNKPGGMPCHPIRPGENDCVMNAVAARFPETATIGDKPNEGGLLHRLDNGTSGALMIARTPAAFAGLRAAIRGALVLRRYEALVMGTIRTGAEIDRPIAHHPKNARKMIPGDPGSSNPKAAGRPALTSIEPIRRIGGFTLVSVRPKTGCRHQIRVHLASIGHPIVGDTLYGGPAAEALAPGRFWLHLCELEFDSPADSRVKVTAPLPSDLQVLLG